MSRPPDDALHSASWFSPLALERPPAPFWAFKRLWHGFMTARVMVALVLLLLQGSVYMLGQAMPGWQIGLCALYLAGTLAYRLLARPTPPGQSFDMHWVLTIGIDILMVSVLQFQQAGGINYTPLFAMAVLLAAVMGSISLALGTAAVVTVLLLANAWWMAVGQQMDLTSQLLQAALTGTGLFIVAFLANQLASRLAREEQALRQSRMEARVQLLVNELVIESLTDGVLVVDTHNVVRAANPSAQRLLGRDRPAGHAPFALGSEHAWRHLADLAHNTFAAGHSQTAELALDHAGQPPRLVHARTQLTATMGRDTAILCVVFLQDLREIETRLRNEKLAAMGRMSAAVAHEFRNPLAAITQANALLQEDLSHPAQRRLAEMIDQNAQRLAHIVGEILDVTRVQHRAPAAATVMLDELSASVCRDWMAQNARTDRVSLALQAPGARISFEPDHLRRILVNLLDNAARYARSEPDSIQVSSSINPDGKIELRVWSDGAPLDPNVLRHLFEPFVSSESRSSGLGLYICRELCERHGAAIGHKRTARQRVQGPVEGNEFFVTFRAAADHAPIPLTSQIEARLTEHARSTSD